MKRLIFILSVLLLTGLGLNAQTTTVIGPDSTSTKELPTVSLYYFEHQFLSVIVPDIPPGQDTILGDPEILNTLIPADLGWKSPFAVNDIEVTAFDVDGKHVYVWKFPQPTKMRDALFMAFFPVEGVYKAYSICLGQFVDWEVSTSSSTNRSVFGRIKCPESAEECVGLLIDRGAFSGEITPGPFIQDGFEPRF